MDQHGLKTLVQVALGSSSSFLEINHEPKYDPQFDRPRVHCSCDFKKPINYPATIRVSHRVVNIGRSSMEHAVDLSVVQGDQLELCAQGKSIMVLMDFESGKSHPWPPEILQALARSINRR